VFYTAARPLTVQEFFTYDVSANGRHFMINANPEQENLGPWTSP
jgi:hypothetical protein